MVDFVKHLHLLLHNVEKEQRYDLTPYNRGHIAQQTLEVYKNITLK